MSWGEDSQGGTKALGEGLVDFFDLKLRYLIAFELHVGSVNILVQCVTQFFILRGIFLEIFIDLIQVKRFK